MLSQLACQIFDVADDGFSVSAHSLCQSGCSSDRSTLHIQLAAKALTQTFGKECPRSLVLARGMPYTENADAAFLLAKRAGFSPGRIVSLGDQCSAIIDGLSIATSFAGSGLSPVALIAADQFSEVVDTESPAYAEWRNMACCLRIQAGGRLRLRAIASISDTTLVSMATLTEGRLKVDKRISAAFRQVDIDAQIRTIDALMELSNERLGPPFLCVTNRSAGRLSALSERLAGRVHVVESRQTHGHTGGADVLLNFTEVLRRVGKNGANIICSANGLGYAWSSALIVVEPKRA
jgi:hypothetical protein